MTVPRVGACRAPVLGFTIIGPSLDSDFGSGATAGPSPEELSRPGPAPTFSQDSLFFTCSPTNKSGTVPMFCPLDFGCCFVAVVSLYLVDFYFSVFFAPGPSSVMCGSGQFGSHFHNKPSEPPVLVGGRVAPL